VNGAQGRHDTIVRRPGIKRQPQRLPLSLVSVARVTPCWCDSYSEKNLPSVSQEVKWPGARRQPYLTSGYQGTSEALLRKHVRNIQVKGDGVKSNNAHIG